MGDSKNVQLESNRTRLTIVSFYLLYSPPQLSPLPPSFRFIYNLATLLIGCKHLFNVIIFLFAGPCPEVPLLSNL